MSGRTVLTAEAMTAAIAAGADPATLELEELTDEQKAEAKAAEEAAALEAKNAEEATKLEAANVDKAAAVTDAKDGKIELLVTQLASAQMELMEAKVAFKGLEAKVNADTKALSELKAIAGDSICKMLVALKGPAMSLEGFSAEQVVARHGEVSAKFLKEFKVGGVAASAVADEDNSRNTLSNVSSLHKARMNAVKIKETK